MRCSAIIVTHNSGATISSCLEALAQQPCEILVVDNASSDDTVRRTEQFVARYSVRLIANTGNRGFGAAVNQGVREATGDLYLVLNPDAIAGPGAISALLQCAQSTQAGAIGGALLNNDSRPSRGFAFRKIATLVPLVFEALLVNQLWPGNPVNRRYRCLDADYSQQQDIEQPAGACLAVTRTAWDSVGGFDEQFFPVWFEDVDFCKRLLESGSRVVYCPAARFRHSGAHSVVQLPFRDKQLFWYTNMLRYARKHFTKVQITILRLAIIKGMLLRSIGAMLGARQQSLGETLSAYWAVMRAVAQRTPGREQA